MSKKLLQAAAGNAGGGEALYVEDVFSTYLYDGNGTTGQVIENGIKLSDANVGGSGFVPGVDTQGFTTSTSSWGDFGTGDFSIEAWVYPGSYDSVGGFRVFDTRAGSAVAPWMFGVRNSSNPFIDFMYGSSARITGSISISLNAWTHIAVTRQSGTVRLFVNGVLDTSATITSSINCGTSTPRILKIIDSGTSPEGYASNIRVVKGTAVYTSAFTPPTEPLTAVTNTSLLILQSPEPFTDNSGNSLAITQVGNVEAKNFGPFTSDEAGAGGLVWHKRRTGTGENHYLYDTERGAAKSLGSNETSGEGATGTGGLTSFNSNGYTYGTAQETGYDYASWTFRKAKKFFDVVTYTGNGIDGRQLPHSLGSVPGCVIFKKTSGTGRWITWHRSLTTNYYLQLQNTLGQQDFGKSLTPTATNLTLVTGNAEYSTNEDGSTYVAYVFAHDAGGFGDDGDENIIKCGTFSGGIQDVDLGFEPQFLLYKRTDSTGSWGIFDVMRGMTADGVGEYLHANTSNAEATGTDQPSPIANGFRWNYSPTGETYIYVAIRRPMKTPESGTEVFTPYLPTVYEDPYWKSSFPVVDFVLGRWNTGSAGNIIAIDRLRGSGVGLETNTTDSESGAAADSSNYISNLVLDKMYGFHVTTTFSPSSPDMTWMFKRATGFFDVVAYTGNGTAGRTVAHNLGVAPEMMIVKVRSIAEPWVVYHTGLNGGVTPQNYHIRLTDGVEAADSDIWNNTAPTSSVFTTGGNDKVNANTQTYIAYLFATLDGVSKVGSFSHTYGTATNVDCGFSNGARFVLWKKYNGTDGWQVYDSVRGINAGADPFLQLNSTAAELSLDLIDPYAAGFSVAVDKISGDYIFLAIA